MAPRNDHEAGGNHPDSDSSTGPKDDLTTPDASEAPASKPAPVVPEIIFPEDEQQPRPAPEADFSTVGTGSVFAISCTFLTILIIVICVGIFVVVRLF